MTRTWSRASASWSRNDPTFGGPLLDAALVVEDGRVALGRAAPRDAPAADRRIDLGGAAVVPGFVDSHTHLVFAGDRSAEFEARMAGEPYDGGGIATTVAATRAASDDELRALPAQRLSRDARARARRRSRSRAATASTSTTRRALCGWPARSPPRRRSSARTSCPPGIDRADYLALVTGPMLAACAPHARWIDVFCEPASRARVRRRRGARRARRRAARRPRSCACTATSSRHGPGVQLAVELGAASVDHCTYLTDADVDALAGGDTVATLLPGVEFSTRSPYPGRAPAARRGRRRSRWPPTATPARASPRRCR